MDHCQHLSNADKASGTAGYRAVKSAVQSVVLSYSSRLPLLLGRRIGAGSSGLGKPMTTGTSEKHQWAPATAFSEENRLLSPGQSGDRSRCRRHRRAAEETTRVGDPGRTNRRRTTLARTSRHRPDQRRLLVGSIRQLSNSPSRLLSLVAAMLLATACSTSSTGFGGAFAWLDDDRVQANNQVGQLLIERADGSSEFPPGVGAVSIVKDPEGRLGVVIRFRRSISEEQIAQLLDSSSNFALPIELELLEIDERPPHCASDGDCLLASPVG